MTKKKNKLKGKFVLGYDTLCDGHNCMMEGEGDDAKPLLFNSAPEAMKELFDSAVSMLEAQDDEQLAELEITKEKVAEMRKVFDAGDPAKMATYIYENPEMNYNNEFIAPADEFLMNRKAIFTGNGLRIEGKKLDE